MILHLLQGLLTGAGDASVGPEAPVSRGGGYIRRKAKPRKTVKWKLPFTLEQAEKLVDKVEGLPVDTFLAKYADAFADAARDLRALLRETQEQQVRERAEATLAEVKETIESAKRAALQQEDDDIVVLLFTMARRRFRRQTTLGV